MPVEERGASKAAAKSCVCEACKKGRKEPSKIAPMTINSYSSRPSGGWVKQMTGAQESGRAPAPTLFMGVELETVVTPTVNDDHERSLRISEEVNRQFPQFPAFEGRRYVEGTEGDYYPTYTDEYNEWRRQREVWGDQRYTLEDRLWREGFGRSEDQPVYITAEEAVSLAQPFGFWHPKHDGSVSGPEFASLPATLEYWYAIRDDLDTMFTGLLHGGMRSHHGDRAGMHISLSVEAFVDSDHLIRFSRLVNWNPSWSRKMSQRTMQSVQDWCHIGEGFFGKPSADPYTISRNATRLQRWAADVVTHGTASNNRYVAINASCGDGRIEFRLPRGTLRIDRFYKNLEWVAAMVEFSRDYADHKPVTFMRWVMGQSCRFTYLKAWISEKYGFSETVEFRPEPAPASHAGTTPNTFSLSRSRSFCPCGDGCYEGDCQNCAEDDEEYCSFCALRHDMAEMYYQTHRWYGNIPAHSDPGGTVIGPRRYWHEATDEEYQYDEYGQPIGLLFSDEYYTPLNPAPMVPAEVYPWLTTPDAVAVPMSDLVSFISA